MLATETILNVTSKNIVRNSIQLTEAPIPAPEPKTEKKPKMVILNTVFKKTKKYLKEEWSKAERADVAINEARLKYYENLVVRNPFR
jgi:hypothetical protein